MRLNCSAIQAFELSFRKGSLIMNNLKNLIPVRTKMLFSFTIKID
jgi:hypothetical protein